MSVSAVSATNELGKMDFLNLLATQLRYQDPMNPADNTEFIAQLAQFSALEAAQNTNDSVGKMVTQTQQSAATALVGKTVAGVLSSDSSVFSGLVQGVDLSGSEAKVLVNNQSVSLSEIKYIR
jgi:flagellar basal-body rod modification protein FlgD